MLPDKGSVAGYSSTIFVVPARAQHGKPGDVNLYSKPQAWQYLADKTILPG